MPKIGMTLILKNKKKLVQVLRRQIESLITKKVNREACRTRKRKNSLRRKALT